MRPSHRAGMSLLEVLLALAILAATLAIITELVSVGRRSAEQARDITMAQIHCESLMGQVAAGMLPLTAVVDVPIDDPNAPNDWLYSLTVEQIDQNGLMAVKVTVSQNSTIFARPVAFSLGRWMMDPASSALTGSSDTTSSSAATGLPSL